MKFKKILCIMFVCCFICGCSKGEKLESSSNIHQEIGDGEHELFFEDHYLVNITYPKTYIEVLDTYVKKQIEQYKSEYLQVVSAYKEEHKAELNINFQSYVKDNRYISIKLDIFQSIYENKEVVETIIYDKEKESFVNIEDLFNEDGLQEIALAARSYFETAFPDECNSKSFQINIAATNHNYEHFVLRKDMIVFYFQEGSLFDKSASFEISYDDLQEFTSMEPEDVSVFVPYEDILNEPVKNIDPNKPMIALTFDDGPTKKYTTAILDALKENQASATFFVLGSKASNFPEILQRMVLEGNEIGNHTYSHKQLTTLSKENIEEEIIHTQESIHDITNQYPQVIRPPYGSKNDTVLQCADGKKIVTWSIDTEDWRSRNTEKIVNHVIKEVKDGDIVLMHDLYASTAEAAIILIPKLQEMGYQLVTVSELYAYGKNDAGKIM